MAMHARMAGAVDEALDSIRTIQRAARENGIVERPRWPMIVLVTPKGWTGPKSIDGKPVEGNWRSHQVPFADMRKPGHLELLEQWMKSYRPHELFEEDGTLRPELAQRAERQLQHRGEPVEPAPCSLANPV